MRADRLVSLVPLLRQRCRLTADVLASELEVTTRTVLRGIEASSIAGVPVYAERGRYGGFALLPGFRTELSGLNHEEALALPTADSGPGSRVFGPSSVLATAQFAAQRFRIEPEADLLSRRQVPQEVPDSGMIEVRSSAVNFHKLRMLYFAIDQQPQWRTIEPIGPVTVRDRIYLLATRSGADRTYRLSRILAAEELPEIAERPPTTDLERLWRERCEQFLTEGHVTVLLRANPARREDLLANVAAVRTELKGEAVKSGEVAAEGAMHDWTHLEVTYEDMKHATFWTTDDHRVSPRNPPAGFAPSCGIGVFPYGWTRIGWSGPLTALLVGGPRSHHWALFTHIGGDFLTVTLAVRSRHGTCSHLYHRFPVQFRWIAVPPFDSRMLK